MGWWNIKEEWKQIDGFEYYYVPLRVSTLSDNLDVPMAMSPYIKDIALSLYGNNAEKAEQTVQVCINSLTAREVSHFANVGPVQILGGKIWRKNNFSH